MIDIKGKISIARKRSSVEPENNMIEVSICTENYDHILSISMTPQEFACALTGQGGMPCTISVPGYLQATSTNCIDPMHSAGLTEKEYSFYANHHPTDSIEMPEFLEHISIE